MNNIAERHTISDEYIMRNEYNKEGCDIQEYIFITGFELQSLNA